MKNSVQHHSKIKDLLLISGERPRYLFSSMHQGRGAILLPSIHPHPLLYQQPEDVVLAPRCCQHAQGHAADILWTSKQKQSDDVTDEWGEKFSLTCCGSQLAVSTFPKSLKHFYKFFFFSILLFPLWPSEGTVQPFCNHIHIFQMKVAHTPATVLANTADFVMRHSWHNATIISY